MYYRDTTKFCHKILYFIMFYFKEPATLNSPWILSHYRDEKTVAIPKSITNVLKNYHILGIDFLYQNYKKGSKGAILNEEDGMNMPLQVSAFLNAMLNCAGKKFLVLIITPDSLLVNWHYHLSTHSGLRVQIVKPTTCPQDFDQEHGLALLLAFSYIKLADALIEYDYFSVVIDNFEQIANKVIVRKLQGDFNIGLTQKSFYIDPDQKLQWKMLNWSNPSCVGKLADFYKIDNDNFASFRDNYRYWWFRLTWNFCESFEKLSDEDKRQYAKTLSEWTVANQLNFALNIDRNVRKRKKVDILNNNENVSKNTVQKYQEPYEKMYKKDTVKPIIYKNEEEESTTISHDTNENRDNKSEELKQSQIGESSSDTIIYENTVEDAKERDPNYVKLPSMDENPILDSIIKNFETSPEPVKPYHLPYTFASVNDDLDQPNCSKPFEDDILMSIINDTNVASPPLLDYQTQISCKKEELFSQIFNDKPCTSKSLLHSDESDFLQSLVESGSGLQKAVSIKKSNNNGVEDILKQADLLLNE